MSVANPEWGGKHTCQHCGAKYYDLNRSPIVCPKCGTQFNPDALLRSRRSKPAPSEKAATSQVAAIAPVAEEDEKDTKDRATLKDADGDTDELGEDDDEGKLIEDASELGEDEDDMAEVLVKGDEPEDT
jgi:uncharacterized protein (TIGR02300 family)